MVKPVGALSTRKLLAPTGQSRRITETLISQFNKN